MFGPSGAVENPTEGDEAGPIIKDFRPKNFERDFPVTPAVVAAVEGTVPATALPIVTGDADPKAPTSPDSSATRSASDSASENKAASTQGSSTASNQEPQPSSPSAGQANTAGAEKAKLLHPSMKPGNPTPPAVA